MSIIRRITAWNNSDEQALRKKGDAARDARSWQEAVGFYARYLERTPEDAAIWVQLGHAQKESGDLTAAERAYLRSLSIEPSSPDTYVQLGHIEKLRGNLNQAFAHYRKAIDLDPQFVAALEEFDKYGGASTLRLTSVPSTSPKAASSVAPADVEKRLELLSDQLSAVKALAFALQKLRRRADDLDRLLAELVDNVASLMSKFDGFQSEIDRRVTSLETQPPSMQGRFSALVEHLGDIAACKRELDHHAKVIDEIDRRQRSF